MDKAYSLNFLRVFLAFRLNQDIVFPVYQKVIPFIVGIYLELYTSTLQPQPLLERMTLSL